MVRLGPLRLRGPIVLLLLVLGLDPAECSPTVFLVGVLSPSLPSSGSGDDTCCMEAGRDGIPSRDGEAESGDAKWGTLGSVELLEGLKHEGFGK